MPFPELDSGPAVRRSDIHSLPVTCRTASKRTIATAVARLRLRVPCIGIVSNRSPVAGATFPEGPWSPGRRRENRRAETAPRDKDGWISCVRKSRAWILRRLKLSRTNSKLNVDLGPIVEPGSLQGRGHRSKSRAARRDESRTGGETKPADVAGIGRNLRLDQDNVKHVGSRVSALTERRSPRRAFCRRSGDTYGRYSFAATNFSSFTISAANLRMPSAVFSVAIALSFKR